MKRWIDFVLTYCLLIFAFALIVSGCMTEKKRLRVCQTCPVKLERKDSTIITRETVHDTVYKTVTVTKTLPNPCAELCDQGKLKPGFKKVFPTSAGSVTLSTRNDSLVLTSRIDSLMSVNKGQRETIERLVTIHEQVPVCSRDHLTWWDNFFIRSGQILLTVLAGAGIWVFVYWKFR